MIATQKMLPSHASVKKGSVLDLGDVIRNLGDHTRDVVLITQAEPIDLPGPKIVWVNRAFTEMTGYSPEEVIGQTPRILQGKDTDQKARLEIRQALQTWQPIRITLKNYTKLGNPFWVDLDLKPVADASGWFYFWVAVQRDVTQQVEDRLKLEQALDRVHNLEERLRFATDAGEIGVWELDFATGFVSWDNVMFRLYGADKSADVDAHKVWREQVNPDDIVRMEKLLRESAETGADFDQEYHIVTPAGNERVLRSRASFAFDATGKATRAIGVEYDITDRVRREHALIRSQAEILAANEKIQHDAVHDALTNIGNRRGVNEHLITMADSYPPLTPVAVLLIDLDHFKTVNDLFGHAGGDYLLCSVAQILRNIAGEDAYIGRLGGDEFVMILSGPRSKISAFEMAAHILEACRQPLSYHGQMIHFGVSIGICTGTIKAAREVFQNADIALYEAKKKGRNQIQLFTPTLRAHAEEKKRRADAFMDALANDRVGVRLQPQICSKTRELCGVEALARWWTEDDEEVLPHVFLPVAEYLGILQDLDAQTLRKAIDAARMLAKLNIFLPKISVNVSLQRLMDPGLLDEVDTLTNIPCPLVFELVESINFDTVADDIIERVDALRSRGIAIEIDDFGSGHASITTLLRVRPDRIKIDKQLIMNGQTPEGQPTPLLQAICEMCQGLDIPMTAEGVETQQIVDMTTVMGFDVLQGFFFAKPLTLSEFVDWHKTKLQHDV